MKRSATDGANPSKRIKTDNDMPPPKFVPRQPSSSATQPGTFKHQTSIRDIKSTQNGYFDDDDEDDEDLWFKASQIEEEELRAVQKNSPDKAEVSYANFQDAQGPSTSTQNSQSSQMGVLASQKLRVLQNKCTALEKQLKRSLPNIAKAQAQASQATNEVSDLKMRVKQLRTENEELRKEKLHEADRISAAAVKIRNENENLRKQLAQLEIKVLNTVSSEAVGQLSPVNVSSSSSHKILFDENKTSEFCKVIRNAEIYKTIGYEAGNDSSIFHKHLVSLQLKIAQLQADFMKVEQKSSFKFSNTKVCGTIDSFVIFSEVAKIVSDIYEDIRSYGLRQMDEHFVRQEFAFKQTQYCSDQYFGDKRNSEYRRVKMALTDSNKLFSEEIRVDHRRLLAMISILARNSKNLSELILVQNVSAVPGDYKTLIDILCDIIDPHILQSRFLYKNSGITAAFTELLRNLSSHYVHFENVEAVSEKFEKFFSHLLAMSTSSPRVLIDLSQYLINVLKHKSGSEMLKKLCKNFPSSNLEYSHMFKIYQIPRCGCLLQIFFIQLTTAFRFMEDVKEHDLDMLFELTDNLNALVYLLIVNERDLAFLQAQSYESGDPKSHCKCYMFLVIALIILNNQVLRHRNVDTTKYFRKLSAITKSAVITMVTLLSYSGPTIDYRSFTFGYNAISEIYTWLRHGDIKMQEPDMFLNCQKILLTEKTHENFLEKILSSTSCDYSYSFIACESSPIENMVDKDIKTAKGALWKQIVNNFWADEG